MGIVQRLQRMDDSIYGGIIALGRLEMEVSKSNMYRWKFRWMTRK